MVITISTILHNFQQQPGCGKKKIAKKATKKKEKRNNDEKKGKH